VNRDLVTGTGSIPEGAFTTNGTPVIAGERVVLAGDLDRTFTTLNVPSVPATPRYSDGVLVLALDPRDESLETPAVAPTWGGPSYRYIDRGTPDPFGVFFAGPTGPAPNPNYDLLGFGIGQAAASLVRTPRGAPLVTPDGVGAFYLVESADPRPRYQWWSAQDTVVACQNRIIAVDSGRTMVRDIPSSGDWQNVGQVILPNGSTRTSELGWFRGISRPRSVRDLAYVMKKGYYHICDSGNNQVVEIGKDGTVVSAILNRDQPAFGGELAGIRAFYDEPGWWPDFDLPAGNPRTLSAPHDAFRWEVTVPVMAGQNAEDWVYQFDWIADTGNNRLLGLMREVPPSTTDPRRERHHLMWTSDPYQALVNATGKVLERGPALSYVSAWPLRTPASACELTDADPSVTIAPPGTILFADGNFAGVVAAINGVALSTVPGDMVNPVQGDPARVDPYPRDLGPGASVALVGRLFNSAGNPAGPLDRIDGQIQWAFSQLYAPTIGPDGAPLLMPFRKLDRVNYLDVALVTGPEVPTGDPAVFYITIADDSGVYPVTYYPTTGPWTAAPANLWAGRAVVSLPPSNVASFQPVNGYGPCWWFDGQEYATVMGSFGRNAGPLPGTPGPDTDPQWAANWLAPDNAYAYPVEYTGLVAGRAGLNPGDPGPAGDLLADTTFSFFRPIHVERQADGQYLVTNGHERKGEVLLLNPYLVDPAGLGPSVNRRRYDVDYLRLLAWILPDPIRYRLGAGGSDENPNTPEIGEVEGGTYNLGQPWAATRRTSF
jgi:hypothetical protein